jgi:hypothetical protein
VTRDLVTIHKKVAGHGTKFRLFDHGGEENISDIIDRKENAGMKPHPGDFGDLIQEQGWYFEDIPAPNTTIIVTIA